jgi:nitrile hydratase accessory protein
VTLRDDAAPVLDAAVTAMTGGAALPRRNGELVFEAPWQGRVFGIALAVVRRLGVDWSEFQRRLITAIAEHPDAPYYDCWVAALERLVIDHQLVAARELDDAQRALDAATLRV